MTTRKSHHAHKKPQDNGNIITAHDLAQAKVEAMCGHRMHAHRRITNERRPGGDEPFGIYAHQRICLRRSNRVHVAQPVFEEPADRFTERGTVHRQQRLAFLPLQDWAPQLQRMIDLRNTLGLQVCAIAQLTDLLQYLETRQNDPEVAQHGARVRAYRERYGVQ